MRTFFAVVALMGILLFSGCSTNFTNNNGAVASGNINETNKPVVSQTEMPDNNPTDKTTDTQTITPTNKPNNDPKVTPWSYKGFIKSSYLANDPVLMGIEFEIKLSKDTGKYRVVYDMAQTNEVAYFFITQSEFKIAIYNNISIEYPFQKPVPFQIDINSNDYTENLKITKDKNYYYFTSKFKHCYDKNSIKELHYTYGKID